MSVDKSVLGVARKLSDVFFHLERTEGRWCELSNAEQKEDKIFLKGLNRRASSGVVGGRYGIGKLLPPFYIHKFSLCFSGLESYTHIRMVWSTFHEDGGV